MFFPGAAHLGDDVGYSIYRHTYGHPCKKSRVDSHVPGASEMKHVGGESM